MSAIPPVLLGLGLLLAPCDKPNAPELDLAQLREVLLDRQDPRGQSQAALLLVQSNDPAAERLVRQGLRRPEDAEVFLALLAAIRLRQDGRFTEELLTALTSNRPRVRQAIAETLAVLPDPHLVGRLRRLAADPKAELAVRQTALWALGKCGRKQAAEALVEQLASDDEDLRRVARAALADLTGQNFGTDTARWKAWWARHRHLTAEQWLEMRLAHQSSRALRLEGDLARSRAQVLRLHQQLYNRLPVGERLAHLQSLVDQDDPAVRALAVVWALEMLPAVDLNHRRELAGVLLRLSHDGAPEVQRGAVLGLARVQDPEAWERLRELLKADRPGVRASAVRALAGQARGGDPGARARQKEVVGLLQKALEDPTLEVVVEAAEALGGLGVPEAGPVLTGLLRHRSEHVRQTAAQALERVADAGVLEGLLKGLDDPSVTVRFSLVGALGRAAGAGQTLSPGQRKQLLARLEELLQRDSDPGVRSRAATVLGECAAPAILETLWRSVQSGNEGRVQEKAWDAFVEVIARSESEALLRQWDRTLAESRQGQRRVQLLSQVAARWQQRPETRAAASKAQEALVRALLGQGKWAAAAPLVRELLAQPGDAAEAEQRLGWLLEAGQQALRGGNRAEALRAVQEARPYLRDGGKLGEAFDLLEKQARKKQ